MNSSYCKGPFFSLKPPEKNASASIAAGRRYEKQVFAEIGRWAGLSNYKFLINPWIQYQDPTCETLFRFCQPDAVIYPSEKLILLIEIKLKHTQRVFPQLDLYKKCLSELHPEAEIKSTIICKYFDPVEGKVPLISSLTELPTKDSLNALQWSKG